MLLLALETSTPLGSTAVGEPGRPARARCFLRRQGAHASGLVPGIRDTLREVGLDPKDLEGVVVGSGPGSFTGVRVAAATAKGLVRALEIPLRCISSLAAAAVAADMEVPGLPPAAVTGADSARPRHVLFDARGDRVYAAVYSVEGGHMDVLEPPRASRIQEILGEGPPPGAFFCGGGAEAHRARLEDAGYRVLPPPAGTPTADALLRAVNLDADSSIVADPGAWEPEYVRAWASRS